MNIREARSIIQQLRQEGEFVEEFGTELLRRTPLRYEDPGKVIAVGVSDYRWLSLDEEIRNIQRDALAAYQRWYSLGLKLVEIYMPARLEEFNSRYQDPYNSRGTVMGWLQLKVAPFSGQNNDAVNAFVDAFDVQRGIIEGIATMLNFGPTIYEYTSPVYWLQQLKERLQPRLSQAWRWLRDHRVVWILGLIFTLLATDWFLLGQNVRKFVNWIVSLIR